MNTQLYSGNIILAVPYLVCLGGVWGRSVERGLLALVPLLEGDTHHREEGRGGEGWREEGGEGQRERGERREGKEK